MDFLCPLPPFSSDLLKIVQLDPGSQGSLVLFQRFFWNVGYCMPAFDKERLR